MLRLKTKSVFVLASILVAPAAMADITFYDIFKNVQYEQTSSASVSGPLSWDFGARIFTNADGEVTEGTIEFGGDSRTLTAVGPRLVGYFDYSSMDEPTLDATYPAGDYTFTNTAGTLPTFAQTVTLPDAVRPNEIPMLTGSSFDDLTNAVAGSGVNVTWNAFTVSGSVDNQLIYFQLLDLTDNLYKVDNFGANGVYLSQAIAGSDLIAGHDYRWTLYYDPRFATSGIGPSGNSAVNFGFDSVTTGYFSVQAVPEPTAFAVLGLGLLGFAKRRKSP